MNDPLLNYFALGLLIFVVIVLFYAIIAIHDIPYLISKKRDHPHQDAIHAAGWVSLFALLGRDPHPPRSSHCVVETYSAQNEELAVLRVHGAARWRRLGALAGPA